MNLMDEKILESCKTLRIQTNKKDYVISWTILSVGIFLAALFWFLAVFGGFLAVIGIFVGIFSLTFGISFFFIFRSQAKRIARNNQKKMFSLSGSLHHYYFENNPQLFPKELQFKGIHPSKVYGNNSLAFNWNQENISWNISEYTSHNSSTSSTSYILKFRLVSSAQSFSGFDNIYITEGKPRSEAPIFESESLLFNERFKVQGNNKLQIYKALTPKIIENFLIQENNFLNPKVIWIYDGTVSVAWSGSSSWESWIPDPLDYSGIHWTKKEVIGDIHKKIATDFGRYLVIQKMLIPLDLY